MHKMTEADLSAAFAGESQAHTKYQIFAQKAEKEFPNVARLFRAIAFAELVHATNHLQALGGIKGILDNLQAAINGENFEVEEMYPAYFEVAKLQGEKEAMRSITFARRAEEIHAAFYQQAKDAVSAGADTDIGAVHICSTCGHTVIGDAPDRCPVCGHAKEEFVKF